MSVLLSTSTPGRTTTPQTNVSLHEHLSGEQVAVIFDELTARAAKALDGEGFLAEEHRFARTVDLRYFGQAFEVRVAVPDGPFDQASLDEVARRFHAEHRGLYGDDFAEETRATGRADQTCAGLRHRPDRAADIATEPVVEGLARLRRRACRRPVLLRRRRRLRLHPVYWRADLAPGQQVSGPAVIEEFGVRTAPSTRASTPGSTPTST